eukprot:CAMPEP_0113394276 /NCGR_PEP_ID=MMETSP0013_2-20120614/12403_1 /TAXON_ID=2843 ORGANISM="Skeletonema costatum, Strain 1716" /NCGR_SAMPLE_ID=MMETSP0013_2 /ASSEMBLY_ACC=CAM_ASM_000158 /LENGTH=325 /DNA_ID=CAMNT_0000278067 /DNA_START=73 /DNA_END=1050 /DNA_ORIENTATION=+ /assembly_acc=CAM_ASM_000158
MADVDDNIFVYLGGDHIVPQDVTHVIIDRSVKIIPARAFQNRGRLVSVETHEGIEKIEGWAFSNCISLRKIKLIGIREVATEAFYNCTSLADVEFGDKLEIIRRGAFIFCESLKKIKLPSVRTVEEGAFGACRQLTDVEFGGNLETIQYRAFHSCPLLRRIAVPLKDDIFPLDPTNRYTQFKYCRNLITVDLVGGIHKTISSLLLESWRTEIIAEIDRINQDLPSTGHLGKTDAIRGWIRTVIDRMEHYKAEHYRLLKEDMTLLELAIWKAKIDEKEDDNSNKKVQAKKAKIDVESARKEQRIKSGANIIIRNVVPFLQLFEEEE